MKTGYFASILLGGLGLSCAAASGLYLEADSIERQLNGAREAGAYRCAPAELARAEAELEFMKLELTQGNATRASQHRDKASTALVTVIEEAEKCGPQDRDGDGVLDPDDACPNVPGLPSLAGCPDRDGDGIADGVDACPYQPEDIDGNQDNDGCPEDEDTDKDGLLDSQDGCPTVPGPPDNNGCPYGDRDGDQILDKDDQCPDIAEDLDGFEDEDGCPDTDNDKDGILDENDICPMEPETFNDFNDEDGCPDKKLTLVEVKRDIGKIEIKQKVFFATGKSRIRERSFDLLNEVAEALKANPDIRVIVEGHTDSVGSAGTNLRLSQSRAESVKTYLIGRGIDENRLTAIGFGEDKPIDTNQTRAGRERNRRVEFTIVDSKTE